MFRKLTLGKLVLLMLIILISIISLFAIVYDCFNVIGDDSSFIQNYYFSGITYLTVGYGDLYPKTDLGKLLVILEGILGLIFNALFTGSIFFIAMKPRKSLMLSDRYYFKLKANRLSICVRIGNKHSELSDMDATVDFFKFKDDRRVRVGYKNKHWAYIDKAAYIDEKIDDLNDDVVDFLNQVINGKIEYQIRVTLRATDSFTNNNIYATKTYSGENFDYIHEFAKFYKWNNLKRSRVQWKKFNDVIHLDDETIDKIKKTTLGNINQ